MGAKPTDKHEIVHFENGTSSVKNTVVGEAMHSSVGPEEEAQRVHIEPSRLRERLLEGDANDAPLAVFDLGLGIAANALAALDCRLQLPLGARRLQIISFENDLSGIEMILASERANPSILRHRLAVETLLHRGRWRDSAGRIEWQLRSGDFLEDDLIGLPAPESIYFDFYSPKATPELWGFKTFEKLRAKCGRRPCTLTTYSAATRVRAALLLAGFFVGYGNSTSAKQETTLATTRFKDLPNPLGAEWFDKFNRSARGMPEDLPAEEWAHAREGVLGSPQGVEWAAPRTEYEAPPRI
jgi:queuine tRNA-ribosyltransferase